MRQFGLSITPYMILIISILFWPQYIFESITGRGLGTRDGEVLFNIIPHLDSPYCLILGSSTAQCGINPDHLNIKDITAYNLGTSAQTVAGSKHILNRLSESRAPDILILDVYSNYFCRSSREFAYDFIGRNPIGNSWRNASFILSQKDNYLTLLFLRSFLHKPSISLEEHSNIRGHRSHITSALSNTPECTTSFTSPHLQNTQALSQIIKICNQNHIKLILTLPPDLCESRNLEFTRVLRNIAPTISIIDGNSWDQRQPEFFIDDHHLNQSGAVAYSKWLNTQLDYALQQP